MFSCRRYFYSTLCLRSIYFGSEQCYIKCVELRDEYVVLLVRFMALFGKNLIFSALRLICFLCDCSVCVCVCVCVFSMESVNKQKQNSKDKFLSRQLVIGQITGYCSFRPSTEIQH